MGVSPGIKSGRVLIGGCRCGWAAAMRPVAKLLRKLVNATALNVITVILVRVSSFDHRSALEKER